MLLAVDVGNTQTVIGLFDESTRLHTWRIASDTTRTADELEIVIVELFARRKFNPNNISTVIVASVVPHLTAAWELLALSMTGVPAKTVGPGLKTGLPIAIKNPHEVGADRIANAVAALRSYGTPVIVVDFGTATNIDVVSDDGRYLGGVISPGLETSADALFSRAARLSAIDLEAPATALGTSTKHAIQSGLIFGEAAKIDGLVRRIHQELGSEAPVVATGGLAGLIAPHCEVVNHVNVDLTIDGLLIIAQLNS